MICSTMKVVKFWKGSKIKPVLSLEYKYFYIHQIYIGSLLICRIEDVVFTPKVSNQAFFV